ncbi:MAG: hypothetical protein JNK02_07095 [Planctomycetes bacterium]|nr:hypothetical protein [Planctomycetota bacterium]
MLPALPLPALVLVPTALIEPAAEAAGPGLGGGALALLLGVVQLLVSLALFTLAVNNGLAVVGRMIEGLDIWGEIQRKNVAVGLLAAGAVIAYTNVVSGGIEGMTKGLQSLVVFDFKNGLSAVLGGAVNLVVALAVAGFAISWTFKIMDRWTRSVDERAEFKAGNAAIGVVHAGILIGASTLIEAGVSGVSSGLTQFLSSLFATLA